MPIPVASPGLLPRNDGAVGRARFLNRIYYKHYNVRVQCIKPRSGDVYPRTNDQGDTQLAISYMGLSNKNSPNLLMCVEISGSDESSNHCNECMRAGGDTPRTAEGAAKEGLGWLDQQGKERTKEAEMEAVENVVLKVADMGPMTDDKTTKKESGWVITEFPINENDERRVNHHWWLRQYAEQGDFAGAEDRLEKMRNEKLFPGPKAYHALIYSYVKGGNPHGALKALRDASKKVKDFRPLPQTYAAILHGFLEIGDIKKAEAMYITNRRAKVSYEKSWVAITMALFNCGRHVRALQILQMGEEDGLKPNRRLYEAMIKSSCRIGELSTGADRLREMEDRGLQPDKDLYGCLVTAYALNGHVEEAEALLQVLLGVPGKFTAATNRSINSLLQIYLQRQLSSEELAGKISDLRQAMVKGGMAFDRKGYALLLEASVLMADTQMGLLALRSLKTLGKGSLEVVPMAVLDGFLMSLSANGRPAELYEVLTLMGCEQKTFASEDMLQDNSGRTFLTAWLTPASNSATQVHDESEGSWLVIDGIQLDPVNLAAVGPDGTILTPSRMSVTELRAELAARQGPLQGNKKELVRQLQKARAEAKVIGGEVEDDKSQSKKVEVMVQQEHWSRGELIGSDVYEEARVLVQDQIEDDDEDGFTADDIEDDEEMMTPDDDEEEEDVDYDDRVYAIMKAQGKFNSDEIMDFSNEAAGIHEALAITRGVIAMGGLPTLADVNALCDAVKVSSNPEQYAAELQFVLSKERVSTELRERMNDLLPLHAE